MEDAAAKYRWDVMWGRTRRETADGYIASGAAKRRRDGGWDMRFAASRYVADVEAGKPSIWA